MSSNIYRQGDSRWGRLKYPYGSSTIASSGCGCCAVTHAIMEQPKYCNYTPADTRPFMVKYAVKGNGTRWAGIRDGLRHYGYTCKELSADTMAPVWKALEQGKNVGVIRMVKGTRGGVRWTSSGHYIMFQDYKVKNNKHYFKIKDSGGRHNDGWFCYETTMKGMFGPIWVCNRITPKIVGKYKGELPATTLKKGATGEEVKKLQKFLNAVFGANLGIDGKFGNRTDSYVCQFQIANGLTEDGIVGSATLGKMKEFVK